MSVGIIDNSKNDLISFTIQWLKKWKLKKNYLNDLEELKIKSTNAFKTQALLQLKNEYCNKQL